uniref:Regulator of G protein signaling 10 n=5 Tax=Equus TaxID=9789 RepID=A0A5F5PP32_HORSE
MGKPSAHGVAGRTGPGARRLWIPGARRRRRGPRPGFAQPRGLGFPVCEPEGDPRLQPRESAWSHEARCARGALPVPGSCRERAGDWDGRWSWERGGAGPRAASLASPAKLRGGPETREPPEAGFQNPGRRGLLAASSSSPSSGSAAAPPGCSSFLPRAPAAMFNRAVSRLSRKRPPSDIHDSDGSPSSSHQNPKSTAKWAASLENLLEDPEGVKRFREFLKKEFSEENVLFWLACEDFKKTQDKKQMQEKAKEIYMTFLSSKASSQVNVEGQSRLNEKILEEPHPLMFQKLQDQIFNLMKYDSYSRFLKSDLFLKHKRTEEEEEDAPDAQSAAKRASRIYNT